VADEQKAQVKDILRKHQPATEPLLKQFVYERRELMDSIHATKADESAIRAQAAKVESVGPT
jgi:Spy/CpxP family protein refolding chaperone